MDWGTLRHNLAVFSIGMTVGAMFVYFYMVGDLRLMTDRAVLNESRAIAWQGTTNTCQRLVRDMFKHAQFRMWRKEGE